MPAPHLIDENRVVLISLLFSLPLGASPMNIKGMIECSGCANMWCQDVNDGYEEYCCFCRGLDLELQCLSCYRLETEDM